MHWLKTPILKISEHLHRFFRLLSTTGHLPLKRASQQSTNYPSREGQLLIFFCFLIGLYVTCVFVFTFFPLDSLQLTLPSVTSSSSEQQVMMVDDIISMHETLLSRVPQFEGMIFTKIAQVALNTINGTGALSTLHENKGLIYLLLGFVRVCFCLLFWLRIYVICAAVSIVWRYQTFYPFTGKDLLGLLSNGHYFDWGIRAIYNNVDEQGQPTLLIPSSVLLPSLASPPTLASPSGLASSSKVASTTKRKTNSANGELKDSTVYQLLTEYTALCKTTEFLLANILAGHSLPSYVKVASKVKDDSISENLPQYVEKILSAVLSAHRRIKIGNSTTNGPEITELEQCFISVLSTNHSNSIKELSPKLIATTILSLLGGRLLVYKLNDERYWTNTSFNPNLSARSILHSVPALTEDFSPFELTLIRRAILYSTWLPFNSKTILPHEKQLNTSLHALKQWTELADGDPETINKNSKKIELFGLISEVQNDWQKAIVNIIQKGDATFLNGTFLQDKFYYLIPIRNMLDLVEDTLEYSKLARIAGLIESDYRLNNSSQDNYSFRDNYFDTQLKPLSPDAIEYVTSEYEINERDLSLWNSLRYVLQFHGWIALNINNKKVGESGLTSCIVKYHNVFIRSAEPTIEIIKGIIPIRFKNFEKQGINTLIEHIPEAISAEIIDDFLHPKHKPKLHSVL